MNKKYYLSWKGGEIEIDALGCKMIPIFNLNGKKKINHIPVIKKNKIFGIFTRNQMPRQ